MLRPMTKAAGLPFADRACLALVVHVQSPAAATDRAWKGLRVGVPVGLVRSKE
jgi:PIN domain nuclease of toxin-antitoxin system